jgi:hypothetical protein
MKGYLIVVIFAATANAFAPAFHGYSRQKGLSIIGIGVHPLVLASTTEGSESSESSEAEVQKMRDLILSLSLEPTDHDRRMRLKDVFHEQLDRPNGTPKRFTDLFDQTLIFLGDELQAEAKKRYFEDQAAAQDKVEDAKAKEAEVVEPDEYFSIPREKTLEEMRLWALVDMMVQSKTIVKKLNGELGSKGTFQ